MEGSSQGSFNHWSARYLSLKWNSVHFNCWHFFRKVYLELLGVKLPVIDTHPDHKFQIGKDFRNYTSRRYDWNEIKEPLEPMEFDAVAMGSKGSVYHVGIWTEVDGGKVVHCNMDQGVTCMSIARLRDLGYDTFKYYRHADNSP